MLINKYSRFFYFVEGQLCDSELDPTLRDIDNIQKTLWQRSKAVVA